MVEREQVLIPYLTDSDNRQATVDARVLSSSAADRRLVVKGAAGKEFVGMRFTTQLNELTPTSR